MNCQKCNAPNSESAVFCASCGTKLETSPLPVFNSDGAQQEAKPQNFPTYGTQQQSVAQQQPTAQQNAPSFPAYGNMSQQQPLPNSYYTPERNVSQGCEWAAITSLVCGIVSLPCCITVYGGIIPAIAAIVFGVLGINSGKRSMSIIGLILGIVGFIAAIVAIIFVFAVMQDPDFINAMNESMY